MLTNEDRTLLERWKSIYPRSSHSISTDDSHETDPVDRPVSEAQSPGSSSVLSNEQEVVTCSLQSRDTNGCIDVAPSLWTDGLSAVQTNCSATCQLSVLPSLMPSAVAPSYLPPPKIQPSFVSLLDPTNNNLPQAVSRSPELLTSLNVSECGRGQERGHFNEVTGNGLLLVARMPSLLTTTKPLLQDTSQAAVGVRLLHDNQSSKAAPMSVAWKINGGMVRADEGEDVGDGISLRTNVIGSLVDNPGSSGLRVNTSRMMRSHVDDLTLCHTPRGTGAGYGVGVDFAIDLSSSGSRAGRDGSVSVVNATFLKPVFVSFSCTNLKLVFYICPGTWFY